MSEQPIPSPMTTLYIAVCKDKSGQITISDEQGREGPICFTRPEDWQRLSEYVDMGGDCDMSEYDILPTTFLNLTLQHPIIMIDGQGWDFEWLVPFPDTGKGMAN